jgi:PAT family beta-lactamase induction signal transducer AmpG
MDFWKTYLNRRLIVAFFMGISSGLPLMITLTLMQAWAKDAGVELGQIGLLSLVGLPYTLKFLWSPIFDRYCLPFLGRRRGWLLVAQIACVLAIVGMGLTDPASGHFGMTLFVLAALIIAFASATQDIIIDAFRREDLKDRELGLGSSLYVSGYRVGMLAVSGGALALSDHLPWSSVFFLTAAVMALGIVTTLFAKEPQIEGAPPKSFQEAVIDPFKDFFSRDSALWILAFILLYKVGDSMAGSLTTPFYMELGYSKTDIALIAKLYGFWATIGGSLLGGAAIIHLGINRSLWIFGVFQMVSTAGFAFLSTVTDHGMVALGSVISFENVTAGMGTAGYLAFVSSITNKKYTATQLALLTSLSGVPRVVISSVTGFMAQSMGWFNFYILCTLIAVPGMLLLLKFARWNSGPRGGASAAVMA